MTRCVRGLAFVLIGLLGLLAVETKADESKKLRIIIDADTANEVDDFWRAVDGHGGRDATD